MPKKGTPPSLATIAARKAQSANWDSVDWTLDNRTIAKQLNRAYNTVAKKRVALGHSNQISHPTKRRYLRDSYPNLARPDGNGQRAATHAAQNSPIAGRTETNIHAKTWRLTAPDGTIYECHNLHHFIRQNPHLFKAVDIVFKRTGGKRGTGGEYCNASSGLQYAAKSRGKWKKWQAEIIQAA